MGSGSRPARIDNRGRSGGATIMNRRDVFLPRSLRATIAGPASGVSQISAFEGLPGDWHGPGQHRTARGRPCDMVADQYSPGQPRIPVRPLSANSLEAARSRFGMPPISDLRDKTASTCPGLAIDRQRFGGRQCQALGIEAEPRASGIAAGEDPWRPNSSPGRRVFGSLGIGPEAAAGFAIDDAALVLPPGAPEPLARGRRDNRQGKEKNQAGVHRLISISQA